MSNWFKSLAAFGTIVLVASALVVSTVGIYKEIYRAPIVLEQVPLEQLSKEEVTEIYDRLAKSLPEDYTKSISFHYEKSDVLNAWAESVIGSVPIFKITITTAFIEKLGSKEAVAAVLAHELAHIVLFHVVSPPDVDQRYIEYNADISSIYILMKAGYSPCVVAKMWAHFLEQGGDTLMPYGHPSYSQRLVAMQLPGCEKVL